MYVIYVHPLLGPLKVPGGARKIRLPQRVCPHSENRLEITKDPIFIEAAYDHVIQSDRMTLRITTTGFNSFQF